MSVVAAAIIGSAVVGAVAADKKNKAAKSAAAQQQAGITAAQQLQLEASQKASETLQPIVDASAGAKTNADVIANLYGAQSQNAVNQITAQQAPLNVNQFLDPSMAFQQAEGQKAIQSSAAARGGLLSGATLKELTAYGQGLASQNYNNAVSQAMQNRSQQLQVGNQLLGMSDSALNYNSQLYNTGLNAIGKQADIISQQGTNSGNLAMSSANVGAAATAGRVDPIATGIASGAGMYSSMFSDENLKKEIETVSDDEIDEFLSKLEGSSYKYKPAAKAKGAPKGRQVGVMAQDVEKSKIGKNIVKHDIDGDKMLDVPKSVSALLASTAVLNKRLKKLEGSK